MISYPLWLLVPLGAAGANHTSSSSSSLAASSAGSLAGESKEMRSSAVCTCGTGGVCETSAVAPSKDSCDVTAKEATARSSSLLALGDSAWVPPQLAKRLGRGASESTERARAWEVGSMESLELGLEREKKLSAFFLNCRASAKAFSAADSFLNSSSSEVFSFATSASKLLVCSFSTLSLLVCSMRASSSLLALAFSAFTSFSFSLNDPSFPRMAASKRPALSVASETCTLSCPRICSKQVSACRSSLAKLSARSGRACKW
mmetsp:Transcript_37582/g.67997  ORF Transcript_37582/g.67997 Transcript_37582/m.67997 type:complete len:261 (+) Transcript_37582:53-835(+)